ncbi:hypothetical protein GGI19_000029 [Coemansia pectinata]|uniref:Uncharacterized protein n=1 Tax=Coemansia pectinata TaxID=1052879 RepID=A0A9W8H3P8_9FUNG|nr:hypothetical protein GGI19_000029 [Coemansia pectinata]
MDNLSAFQLLPHHVVRLMVDHVARSSRLQFDGLRYNLDIASVHTGKAWQLLSDALYEGCAFPLVRKLTLSLNIDAGSSYDLDSDINATNNNAAAADDDNDDDNDWETESDNNCTPTSRFIYLPDTASESNLSAELAVPSTKVISLVGHLCVMLWEPLTAPILFAAFLQPAHDVSRLVRMWHKKAQLLESLNCQGILSSQVTRQDAHS